MEAEQHDYDVGVAEIKDALRAKVPTMCRTYCAQTWDEALNRAGVEASSKLRKLETSSTHKLYKPRTLLPPKVKWPLQLLSP